MKNDMIEQYENEDDNRDDAKYKDQVVPDDDIHNDIGDDDNMELFEDSNFNDSFNSINVDMNKINDDDDDVKDDNGMGNAYKDDNDSKIDYENDNIQHVSSDNNNTYNENNITLDMMNVDSKIKINNDTSININNKNNDYNFLKAQFKNKQLEHDFIENGELTEEMLEFLWDTAFNNNHSLSSTVNSSNNENNDNDDNIHNLENGWYKKVLPPRKYPESKYHLESLKLKTTIKISTANLKLAATTSTATADNKRSISNKSYENIDDYKNGSTSSSSSSSIGNCDKNSISIVDSNKLSSLNYNNYYDYKNDTIINENDDGDDYYYKNFDDDDNDDDDNNKEFTDNTIKNSQQALILNNPEYIFDVSPPIVIDRIRSVEVLSLPKINNCYGSKNNNNNYSNNNNKEKKQYNEDDNYNATILKIKSDSLLNKKAKRAKQQEIREFLRKDKNRKYL